MSLTSHLQELKKKHANLSRQVEDAQRTPSSDPLDLSAMKKRKLQLKEEIERLSS